MKYIIIYLIIINIISNLLFFIDKKKAIKNKRRISEKTFMILSVLGGGVGIILGMKTYRHKTLKNKFKYGIPLIIILQMVIVLLFKFN